MGWDDVVGCRDSQRIDLELHILHVGCQTNTHIERIRTFDYSDRFAHGFIDHSFVRLRLSGRLPGIFVNFLSLGGSHPWCDFLLHI